MTLATVHIPDWARHLLSGAIISNNMLDLEMELSPDQFQAMHKIVLAMGGRYDRDRAAFTFPAKTNVEDRIRYALAGHEHPPAPPPNPEGRWDTPSELGWEILHQARVEVNTTVLDMCAGSGHLSGLAIASGARVYAVEADETCVLYLQERMKGLKKLWHMETGVWLSDMKKYLEDRYDAAGNLMPKMQFKAIVSHSTHESLLDLGITRALWAYVAPGGSLVTVISAENYQMECERATKFRLWCDEIAADMIPVSDKMYQDYGALNDALLFVGEKPNEP